MGASPERKQAARADAGGIPSRVAYGPDRPDRSLMVDLKVDRGLASGKWDTITLTTDEAVALATDLLEAVRLVGVRRRNRDAREARS